jgi:hypothetical protein
MKFFLITPNQKIEVVPYAYTNDMVQCEIEHTNIDFATEIKNLQTEDERPVTRRMLNALWDK